MFLHRRPPEEQEGCSQGMGLRLLPGTYSKLPLPSAPFCLGAETASFLCSYDSISFVLYYPSQVPLYILWVCVFSIFVNTSG